MAHMEFTAFKRYRTSKDAWVPWYHARSVAKEISAKIFFVSKLIGSV